MVIAFKISCKLHGISIYIHTYVSIYTRVGMSFSINVLKYIRNIPYDPYAHIYIPFASDYIYNLDTHRIKWLLINKVYIRVYIYIID